LLAVLAAAAPAGAKDFKFNTAPEAGYTWFFAYDTRASHVKINPALCYGGTLFQIVDFNWSRNMMFELNYLFAQAKGEQFNWTPIGGNNGFVMDWHSAAANVGYMFEGRRLHPYLSGGLGAVLIAYADRAGVNLNDTEFTLNLGGGVDYTLWETGRAGLTRLDLGLRIRYYYSPMETAIMNVALNAVSMTLRLNLRW
jgi:hypothetical protein